jgi:hypothetical protein
MKIEVSYAARIVIPHVPPGGVYRTQYYKDTAYSLLGGAKVPYH